MAGFDAPSGAPSYAVAQSDGPLRFVRVFAPTDTLRRDHDSRQALSRTEINFPPVSTGSPAVLPNIGKVRCRISAIDRDHIRDCLRTRFEYMGGMTAQNRLITKREAAAYCGVSLPTFSKWVLAGIMPPAFGATRRWDRRAIDAAIDAASGLGGELVEDAFDRWEREHDAKRERGRT
jgi:predicted DNA-binding transcriptional regulator AlpA